MRRPLRILALGAASQHQDGATPLAIELEFRQLEQLVQQFGASARLDLTCVLGIQLRELSGLLVRHRPHVVFLSGHLGDSGGVIFPRSDGITREDSGVETLVEIFRRAGISLQVVLLSVCHSQSLAQKLAEVVPLTIGMADFIHDPAARCFSTGFLEALLCHHPLKAAFDAGISALYGHKMPVAAQLPRLVVQSGLEGIESLVLQSERTLKAQLDHENRQASLPVMRIALHAPPDLLGEGAAVRRLVLELADGFAMRAGLKVTLETWSPAEALVSPPDLSIVLLWSQLAEREEDTPTVASVLSRWARSEVQTQDHAVFCFRRRLAATWKAETLMAQVSQLFWTLQKAESRSMLTDVSLTETYLLEHLPPVIKEHIQRCALSTAAQAPSLTDLAGHSDGLTAQELERFLQVSLHQHRHLPLIGVNPELRLNLGIHEVYVPLRGDLRRSLYKTDQWHGEDGSREVGCGEQFSDLNLEQAFTYAEGKRGIVILGDPGSGKTTLLKLLLVRCIQDKGDALGLPRDVVPVMLPLRDLKGDLDLDAFFQRLLNENKELKLPADFAARLRHGRPLLYLLDGLDEVADETERARVSHWIRTALNTHSNAWFAVSSRYAGYQGETRFDDHFAELNVRPLRPEEAQALVRNFYKIVENAQLGDNETARISAESKATELWSLLCSDQHRTRRMRELQVNPLLLTILCLVHQRHNDLPDKRWRLYELCVDTLVWHWRKAVKLDMPFALEDARRLLLPLAHWLHQKEGRRQATASEIVEALATPLSELNLSTVAMKKFLKDVRDRSGLLVGWGSDSYGFIHLAFQEHLTAKFLQIGSHGRADVLEEAARHFGESWWTEVTLLLVSLPEPCLFEPFMRRVLKGDAFALPDHRTLLADCVADAAVKSPVPFLEVITNEQRSDDARLAALWALRGLRDEQKEKVIEVCRPLSDSQNPAIRAQARELLEARGVKLADKPILEVGTVWIHQATGLEFVYVPPGSFMMGGDKFPDEQPIHRVSFVRGFWIGKYPVTNAQYGRFLAATGHREPGPWQDREFNGELQPVVEVDWNDAMAFCRWADELLRADKGDLPPGVEMLLLPSEAEWEYAARGPENRKYPWGDEEPTPELANFGKNVGRTTPVGQYPRGASWVGAQDMAGNVWEWCADPWHGKYTGAPIDGRPWVENPSIPRGYANIVKDPQKARVVRGGSWGDFVFWVRSARRDVMLTRGRSQAQGFRVLASALPGGDTRAVET